MALGPWFFPCSLHPVLSTSLTEESFHQHCPSSQRVTGNTRRRRVPWLSPSSPLALDLLLAPRSLSTILGYGSTLSVALSRDQPPLHQAGRIARAFLELASHTSLVNPFSGSCSLLAQLHFLQIFKKRNRLDREQWASGGKVGLLRRLGRPRSWEEESRRARQNKLPFGALELSIGAEGLEWPGVSSERLRCRLWGGMVRCEGGLGGKK